MFRRLAESFGFHSSLRLTTGPENEQLRRAVEDLKWLQYDEPTYMRRLRQEIENERVIERSAA